MPASMDATRRLLRMRGARHKTRRAQNQSPCATGVCAAHRERIATRRSRTRTHRPIYFVLGCAAERKKMAQSPKKSPKKASPAKPLSGKIALVAGATRGAGRGIAIALGEAGATVYCTGRSSRGRPATPGRSETIEETAELVTAAGGHGIAVRVNHTEPAEVKELVARIKRGHQGLDILVNDVWGGDPLTEWGKTFWTVNLENGLRMLEQAIHSHIITAHYAVPLMLGRRRGII